MMFKRRSANDNGAVPSKKRVKAENKSPQPKKRIKKPKVDNENREKSQKSEDEIIDVKQEIPDDFDIAELNVTAETDINHANLDLPSWPVEHMSELLQRLEFVLPEHETLTYKSRIKKINWNEIAFDNYSGAECRLMWDSIQKRIRHFRILRELIEDAKTWITKPWTNFYRGPKTNRHPDLPRRPLSSYMIYYLKKKDTVLQEHPGLDMTELSKHISEMYRTLSAKSKRKYKELAAAKRCEYKLKMKEFNRLHPELARKTTKKERAVVAPPYDNVPPKPLTPFKLFCDAKLKRMERGEDFVKHTFVEKCKEKWRTMSDKKKVFWINWSLDKEGKYYEEIKKYISENPDYVPTKYKSVVTKEERAFKAKMAGKPEKPPHSAKGLFSRLMLVSEDVKAVTPKKRMHLITQQWKNCTDVEKKEYNKRVKRMLEQYKLQYAKYLESLPEEERQIELLNSQLKRKVTKPKSTRTFETVNKKCTKVSKSTISKIKIDKAKKQSKKDFNLYEGEPKPPPANPYLLFVESYQASYPQRSDAQEVWENMNADQRKLYRKVLWDMKKVHIQNYEEFLKSLTLEKLKEYSEWKNTAKLTNYWFETSLDKNSSESDGECSVNSNSDNENKSNITQEASDDSDSSD